MIADVLLTFEKLDSNKKKKKKRTLKHTERVDLKVGEVQVLVQAEEAHNKTGECALEGKHKFKPTVVDQCFHSTIH